MSADAAMRVEVRPGQVWADNDPRAKGRTFRVIERLPNGARCVVLTDREGAKVSRVGWEFLCLARRFRPTSSGYRLVEDVT
jgi:hypothetical protein